MATKAPEATPRNLRVFGIGLGCVLGLFCFIAWRKGAAAFPYLLAAGSLSIAVALAYPMAFKPVYGPWMKLAAKLAAVNTFLVTALVYYLVITPSAIVMRLLGKDLLDEKLGTGESYWKIREEAPALDTYTRQF